MRKLKNPQSKPWNDGFKCWLAEQGVMLESYNFHSLRSKLRGYLAKAGLDLGDVNELIHKCVCAALEKERRGVNVHCTPEHEAVHPETQEKRKWEGDPRGPKNLKRGTSGTDAFAWRWIHLSAIDGALDAAMLKRITGKISCGVCKSHADSYIRKNPPPFGSPSEMFRWTVHWHNFVNSTLGRPSLSDEDAARIWS